MELTHVAGSWEKYGDFCSLLDDFYREQTRAQDLKNLSGAMERSMTTVKKRLERKLAGQKQELQTAEEREKLKRTADLITANLYAIRSGDKSVVLTDYFDPELPQVKVELDPLLSPQENAQRLFGKYTRLKRAEEALTRQIELGEQELEYVDNVLYTLAAAQDAAQIKEIREELIQAGYVKPEEKGKRKPKPLTYAPRQFTVEGGFTVLCGRNNRENDELTHRRAGKNDIWFHARNVPGSHAVLFTEGQEPSDEALRQAASIAAYYSSAANQPRVPVDYTLVRRVKKPQGAKAGMVNYFAFKTALVEPELPKE
jgi:predicted ribosome quality control (RQC) complex YloA/Tae2 family protein